MADAKIKIEAEDKFSATVRHAKAQFAGLQESVGRVSSITGTLSSSFAGLATSFVAGGLIGGIKSLVGSIDDLDEAAQGLGTTAVALSELQMAARESGVNSEQLGQALTRLNVKIAEAAGGSEQAIAAFKAMGISVRDANGNVRSTEGVLGDVANAFARYRDGTEKSALAVELFGRSGSKLVAYLNQGSDALRKNSGLTEETVKQSMELQREFDALAANAQRAAYAIAGPLASAINSVFDAFRQMPDGQLSGLNYQIKQLRDNMSRVGSDSAVFSAMAVKLAELEKRADELNRTLGKSGDDLFIKNSSALRNAENMSAAPILGADKEKEKNPVTRREQIDDSSRALATYIEGLRRQIDAELELTEVQKAQQFLKANNLESNAQVSELVLQQAALADAIRAENEQRKESSRLIKEQEQESKRLTDQVMELAGVAEQERIAALNKQIDLLVEQGRLTQDQAERARKGLKGVKGEVKDTDDFAGNLGSSLKSAFGDAIVDGEKFGDVLKRLNDRILSMVTDKIFENAFGELFAGLFGRGGGGSLFSSIGGIFAIGGGGFGGGAGAGVPGIGAGDIPMMNIASARGGVTVINNINQVGSNVSRADMLAAMDQTRAATIGQISDLSARGRLKLA